MKTKKLSCYDDTTSSYEFRLYINFLNNKRLSPLQTAQLFKESNYKKKFVKYLDESMGEFEPIESIYSDNYRLLKEVKEIFTSSKFK